MGSCGPAPRSPDRFKVSDPTGSRRSFMTSAVVVGAGVTIAALGARWGLRTLQRMRHTASLTGGSPFVHYYQGGFESAAKMGRREANLILGLREGATKETIRDAHRRIMISNHPDRGGSPYLATKINEAKATLDPKS